MSEVFGIDDLFRRKIFTSPNLLSSNDREGSLRNDRSSSKTGAEYHCLFVSGEE
jgi:hypothetical protein